MIAPATRSRIPSLPPAAARVAPLVPQPDPLSTRTGGEIVDELIEQFTPRLLSVAKRFLNNDDDAADAVQDAFVLAISSFAGFRHKSSVYTWLYRILVNVCLMKLRSASSERCLSLEVISRISDCGRGWELPDALASQPHEKLESDETVSLVRRCIDRLPWDYRAIILLRDIEQLSTDETATLLRVSSGVVKTRLHRARRALRALIEVTGFPHYARVGQPAADDRCNRGTAGASKPA